MKLINIEITVKDINTLKAFYNHFLPLLSYDLANRSKVFIKTLSKYIWLFLLVPLLSACIYDAGDGYSLGLPSHEKRDIAVTEIDLKILQSTDEILTDETHWSKAVERECQVDDKQNLFCALYYASIEVNGVYNHRQAALQEVRFAIDDHYKDRLDKHRLADFNHHSETTFDDVKRVLSIATERVKAKLEKDHETDRQKLSAE